MNRQDPGLQHGRALARVLALLTALATPLLASAEEHGGEHGGHAARVTATTPLRRDVTITHDYVSQIHANRHIEVRALERGYLESVEVTEGRR
jgi:membrane fusion protein (multidrug efflux system)